MEPVLLEDGLRWHDVAAIADGRPLELGAAASRRIERAAEALAVLVEGAERIYGVTTGVGALADTVVDRAAQSRLSRNIVMSHACGVGPELPATEVRAIIAAQVANLAHGHSGVRPVVVARLLDFLSHDVIPVVPSQGSAGYLTHAAHVALALIDAGPVRYAGKVLPAASASTALGWPSLELVAKEGLALVNGTPCSTGLACVALARSGRLLDWQDAVAALSLEALGCQRHAFDADVLALRRGAGLARAGARLRARLADSDYLAAAAGRRTQDALSLRAVPHVHGMAHDAWTALARIVDDELASVTDNPAVLIDGSSAVVRSEAHAVAASLAQALDASAIAFAHVVQMSERRIDRLVNPLVSGLPAFLAADPGAGSGMMIAQYTACALAAECRRLAMPASLDGGVTSALQEDYLAHPTAAASKLLALIAAAERVAGIELVVAAEAWSRATAGSTGATANRRLVDRVRQSIAPYADDRPLGPVLEQGRDLIVGGAPDDAGLTP